MADYKIKKSNIGQLLEQWGREFTVLVPSREGDVSRNVVWDGRDTAFLERYRNTVVPPKASFFPPVEEMFRFQKDKKGYHLEMPTADGRKRLIFGIRPCDAAALALMDKVFGEGYEDPYYLTARGNTMLVGLTCAHPYDSCFCTSLGSSPSDAANVDLLLTDIGDEFLIEGTSDKGRELLVGTEGLEAAAAGDSARADEAKKAAAGRVFKKVDFNGVGEKLAACFEDEEYWQRAADKCISCGICTFICPTCHCFDINDELVGKKGVRYKSWDSCSFPVYTKMPMENPRKEKWRRLRQKVGHKYRFYPMNFGVVACIGCGRCLRLCPVSWDITETLAGLPEPAPTGVEG